MRHPAGRRRHARRVYLSDSNAQPPLQIVPRMRRRTLPLILFLTAGLGLWSGWNAEKSIYGTARVQIEGVLSTRPHLLKSPVPIYTPTPPLTR